MRQRRAAVQTQCQKLMMHNMAAGHKQISNKVEFAKPRFGLIAMAAPLTATLANQRGPLSSYQFPVWNCGTFALWLRICNCRANYKPRNCSICINTMWMWMWDSSWSWSWEQEQLVNRLTHYVIILLQRVIGRKLLPPNDKCMSRNKRAERIAAGCYRL